ncbi:MAG TPA: discoidin domain-containing protein, partial [Polyangia bacterium]|nr:discoidin domain-containing protein [Polyangia bacterium]
GGTAGAGTAGATVGGTAGAGTAGDQGTAGATVGGTAGAGTAGATVGGTAGDQGGTAGATVMVCANSTVVSAGGTAANCGPTSGWTATAMPTPASKLDGIMDNLLQPQYAIDGDPATRYSSGATMMNGDYFQVDLGSAKMVSGITVDTSEGSDITDVANGYEVDLSTDGTNFTKIVGCAFPAAPMETIYFTATSARYVRYMDLGPPSNGGTSWLSIHEFTVTCN